MNDKKKFSKTKKWIKDHQDDIMVGGAVSAVAAVYIGITVIAYKAWQKQMEEEAAQRAELGAAVGRGASVLPGPDGEYWIIENQG